MAIPYTVCDELSTKSRYVTDPVPHVISNPQSSLAVLSSPFLASDEQSDGDGPGASKVDAQAISPRDRDTPCAQGKVVRGLGSLLGLSGEMSGDLNPCLAFDFDW